MVKHHLMPSYYFNERFYIVYNINLIMFYDLLIFIFMSYIKPQPMLRLAHRATVVYRTIPTSNHNVMQKRLNWIYVVYRTIPTSNHNPSESKARSFSLYIVLFLHQTTTDKPFSTRFLRCISYYSYIKSQPARKLHTPIACCISYYSYIKPQRCRIIYPSPHRCISYYSYIKPQHHP